MKIHPRKITYNVTTQQCAHCQHVFLGKVCNQCGEKVFDKHQLSASHFLHEIIDFFYHFENKVIRTIGLNFWKPGFVTAENLRGVRVPYARPVQLYLVVALLFFVVVSKVGVTDYVPNAGDHHYYQLSDYTGFGWAKPIDDAVKSGIDSLWVRKTNTLTQSVTALIKHSSDSNHILTIPGLTPAQDVSITPEQVPTYAQSISNITMLATFNTKVATLGKSMVFLLLPFFAALFFAFFHRQLGYYGAALILANHFLVFNLCAYTLYALINIAPYHISPAAKGWLSKPILWVLFNTPLKGVSNLLWHSGFECIHHLMWMPWLMIAFRRLFGKPWWINMLVAFVCCKVFFFLIFGVLKKALIAFTIWSL